jgi:hypothetical protein
MNFGRGDAFPCTNSLVSHAFRQKQIQGKIAQVSVGSRQADLAGAEVKHKACEYGPAGQALIDGLGAILHAEGEVYAAVHCRCVHHNLRRSLDFIGINVMEGEEGVCLQHMI